MQAREINLKYKLGKNWVKNWVIFRNWVKTGSFFSQTKNWMAIVCRVVIDDVSVKNDVKYI